MLTLDEVRNIKFKKASIGGYRVDEVDSFIDDVEKLAEQLEDLPRLRKENADYEDRCQKLMKMLEEKRMEESAVSAVLVKAQKDADKIRAEAQAEAKAIMEKAHRDADKALADTNSRIKAQKQQAVRMTEEAALIRKKLIENYKKQIESLMMLPEDGESARLRDDLDSRYPTKTFADEDKAKAKPKPKAQAKEEEAFQTIEEAVENATAATEDTANAEAAAAPVIMPASAPESEKEPEKEDVSKDGKIQIDKSKFESRFGKLKFGEDYDVKKAD